MAGSKTRREEPPLNDAQPQPLEVVAGVIADPAGRVLVTQRPPGRARAGFWEFPGGKREPGEVPRDTLVRELREELGLEVRLATRLLVLTHTYADALRPVRLDCWRATQWAGVPRGLDGQSLRWCFADELPALDLLEADRPLVTALRLPALFAYEPDPSRLLARVRARRGAAAVSRVAWLSEAAPEPELVAELAGTRDLLCVIGDAANGAVGVVPVYRTAAAVRPPLRADALCGALVHTAAEARAAREAGCQFLLVPRSGLDATVIEEIGAQGLPYYVNVARDDRRPPPPRALLEPRPLPTGQLWWKDS